MDENARRDPEDSGEESNGAIPPLILPPGNQQSHRTTNFYIDNILRPDFGRKRKGGTPIREAREVMGSAPKIANPDGQRSAAEGADGSPPTDDRRPDPLGRKGEPRDGEESEQLRGDDRSPCRSPRASGAAPDGAKQMLWPAWVYCTRYSDRPSSGPRSRKPKRARTPTKEDKRPRTAFSEEQLRRLKAEFQSERYLTEQRRRELAGQLALNESQIKIWFQNKRAKLKKATGGKNSLALHLMAQGLYNHASAKDAKSDSD